jgi:hypothetical protein
MSLIELIGVTAITALAISGTLYIRAQSQFDRNLDAAGHAIRNVGIAVENYTAKYAYEIREGTLAVPGVVDPARPTLLELVNIGMLPTGFDPTHIPGGQMSTAIERVPAGCVVEKCDLDWVTHTTKPITRPGLNTADEAGAGRIVKLVGAMSGYSPASNPSVFHGYNGSWTTPVMNPTGQAGIVAVRGGYGSSVMAKFLRVDGGNEMTGDIKAGGHNLINVNHGDFGGDLKVEQKVTVGETVTPGANSGGDPKAGDPCAAPAGTIDKDVFGNLLVCKGGKWTNNSDNPGFSAAQMGCKKFIYGPANSIVQIYANDAGDINGLMSANAYGKDVNLGDDGVFTYTATGDGSKSGYIQVFNNGRAVTGLGTSCLDDPDGG